MSGTPRRRWLRRGGAVAVLLAAAVALAGCSGDPGDPATPSTSPTPSATPTRPPRAEAAPRPQVGDCYRLSYEQALAPTSEVDPVRCRRGHTAVTYYVGTLDLVVDGHLLAVDAARVRSQAAQACPRRLAGYLGGTEEQLRLSMLRPVWFSPTLAQSDEGQDWFRCDVISPGDGQELHRLGVPPRRALATAAGRTAYGVCGTAEPGAAGFERVPCAARHRWRAVTTYQLTGKAYPGRAAVRAVADERCQAVGKERADDPLTYRWGFDYPTEAQWRSGVRYGLCWVPD
ncbi:septum formation family protein [Nocardioides sp.]|uniref:septum formation family protein n=1 Tax=Nocardioides sp. TaxID=35761 RepID=UPI003528637E